MQKLISNSRMQSPLNSFFSYCCLWSVAVLVKMFGGKVFEFSETNRFALKNERASFVLRCSQCAKRRYFKSLLIALEEKCIHNCLSVFSDTQSHLSSGTK